MPSVCLAMVRPEPRQRLSANEILVGSTASTELRLRLKGHSRLRLRRACRAGRTWILPRR